MSTAVSVVILFLGSVIWLILNHLSAADRQGNLYSRLTYPSGIVFEFRALILRDLLWNLKGGIGNCIGPNDSQILQGLSISSCLSSVYTTRLTQRQSIHLQQNAEVREKDQVERRERSLETPSLPCEEMGCYSATLQTTLPEVNNRGDSGSLEVSITALA